MASNALGAMLVHVCQTMPSWLDELRLEQPSAARWMSWFEL